MYTWSRKLVFELCLFNFFCFVMYPAHSRLGIAFIMRSVLKNCLPAVEFSNRTVRHKLKYHPHHLDTWQSTTVRFRRNILPSATELWNGLPAAVFLGRYDMGTFKKGVYLYLIGRQSTCSSSGVARGRGRR